MGKISTSISFIDLATRGELVSTTDMPWAFRLGQIVSVMDITAGRPAHFEDVEDGSGRHSLLLYVAGEMYELNTAAA